MALLPAPSGFLLHILHVSCRAGSATSPVPLPPPGPSDSCLERESTLLPKHAPSRHYWSEHGKSGIPHHHRGLQYGRVCLSFHQGGKAQPGWTSKNGGLMGRKPRWMTRELSQGNQARSSFCPGHCSLRTYTVSNGDGARGGGGGG